jgi:hypothetical protein
VLQLLSSEQRNILDSCDRTMTHKIFIYMYICCVCVCVDIYEGNKQDSIVGIWATLNRKGMRSEKKSILSGEISLCKSVRQEELERTRPWMLRTRLSFSLSPSLSFGSSRDLILARQALLSLEPHSTSPFFVKVFFEIGSWELFAWAGFEPRFSWSLPQE